jgi:hypothetical protein
MSGTTTGAVWRQPCRGFKRCATKSNIDSYCKRTPTDQQVYGRLRFSPKITMELHDAQYVMKSSLSRHEVVMKSIRVYLSLEFNDRIEDNK